mmetsp:Transcript_56761/g.93917  ORF Transcript_56761/g.93917 Transcript_56761/m.93917 type:complete len:202 (-) Transcript_56761:475-1080(-)
MNERQVTEYVQLNLLKTFSAVEPNPNKRQRKEMAQFIGMPLERVTEWFRGDQKAREAHVLSYRLPLQTALVEPIKCEELPNTGYVNPLSSRLPEEIECFTDVVSPYAILWASKMWLETWGFNEDNVVGATFKSIQGADTDLDEARKLILAAEHGLSATAVLVNYTTSGTPFRHTIAIEPITNLLGVAQFYRVRTCSMEVLP